MGVTERPKPASGSIITSETVGAVQIPDLRPCCPIIKLQAEAAEARNVHRRSRNRNRSSKAVPKSHPPPRFFRPDPELGGKSKGYALGWASSSSRQRLPMSSSSFSRTDREGPRYIRDRMKKGYHVDIDLSTRIREPTKCTSARDRK